jgi:hypothetical protein
VNSSPPRAKVQKVKLPTTILLLRGIRTNDEKNDDKNL